MRLPEEIERRIVGALPGARVRVADTTGGGDHFRVIVVAPQFDQRSLVERHRMVYAPLRDLIGGPLHAIGLETFTPEEEAQGAADLAAKRSTYG
jgi:stress-induced morphogen